MAHDVRMADDAVNTEADAFARRLDGGYVRIYAGARPATGDAPVGVASLLAELRLPTPSAPAAVGGVVTFYTATSDPSANAGGSAAWFRLLASDGTTPLADGSAGSGPDYDLDVGIITVGEPVDLTGFSWTVPK